MAPVIGYIFIIVGAVMLASNYMSGFFFVFFALIFCDWD